VFGRYGAFSVSAVYLQQFPSYSNHNWKKSSFLRTPAFIFCLPWGRPCGNHAKRCMNEKTIQCLPNPSQHVPIYLQQFPSYSNHNCKKIVIFTYPGLHFLFALGTPLWQTRKTLHEWKDNSVLAKPLAVCTRGSGGNVRLSHLLVSFLLSFSVWPTNDHPTNQTTTERQ